VPDRDLKQVIVMRKDLNMRKGKMVAQGSHASGMFLVYRALQSNAYSTTLRNVQDEWMQYGMAKICVSVDSLEELLAIATQGREAGLTVHIITDSGRTEFGGVPTQTCLAIGPGEVEEINKITGHLKLL